MKRSRGDQSGGEENKRKKQQRTTMLLSVVNILKTEFSRVVAHHVISYHIISNLIT